MCLWNKKLKQQLSDLQSKYDIDSKYYKDRIQSLQDVINKSIRAVSLQLFTNKLLVVPSTIFQLQKYEQADKNYYAFSVPDWVKILDEVFKSFKITYKDSVFDCDDFALLFSGLLSYSVYKSGFDKQFAFGIAWSDTHAFNIFVDCFGEAWIYEPQTNEIIGAYNKVNPPYITNEVWFMS